jgi:hypothetical protein
MAAGSIFHVIYMTEQIKMGMEVVVRHWTSTNALFFAQDAWMLTSVGMTNGVGADHRWHDE